MQAEDWKKINNLFQAVVSLPLEERSGYLEKECPQHLREEIETLIQYHNKKESILDRPVSILQLDEETDPLIGQSLGAFRIMRKIGKGGMGSVYLAIRDKPYKQLAAIKVLNKDLKSEENQLRFFRECQILAALDHPNIPKLIDGNTNLDGISYFIMDYVEGWSIDEYCNINKLSVDERLRLFLRVCSAVEHVHSKNIIHCDIKPSNILINPSGVPKLLDFGIAAFVNPELSQQAIDPTSPTQRRLTRRFASPEQLRGDPITFASDLYSLGTVLYELLTGHHPDREKVEKPSLIVMCEEDVPGRDSKKMIITPESVSSARNATPTELVKRLDGDLDEIVLKAIREEMPRRYLEVKDLSTAIENNLKNWKVRVDAQSSSDKLPAKEDQNVGNLIGDHSLFNLKRALFVAGLLVIVPLLTFVYMRTIRTDPFKPGYEIVKYDETDWNSLIDGARERIRAEGIYLNMVKPERLTKRLVEQGSLKAEFFLLDPSGEVVLQREKDENHLNRMRIMQKFLDFRESIQRAGLDRKASDKIILKRYNVYPTLAVIIIDDNLYAYFYTYGELGTNSPMMKINRSRQPEFFNFFERHLDAVDKVAIPVTEADYKNYEELLRGN